MSIEIDRLLEVYEKNGDRFLFELPIRDFDLPKFRVLFQVLDDDPLMYLGYEVREEHLSGFQQHVDAPIELGRYAYFVSARASGA